LAPLDKACKQTTLLCAALCNRCGRSTASAVFPIHQKWSFSNRKIFFLLTAAGAFQRILAFQAYLFKALFDGKGSSGACGEMSISPQHFPASTRRTFSISYMAIHT